MRFQQLSRALVTRVLAFPVVEIDHQSDKILPPLSSIAASLMPAIAATTPHPTTSSRSTRAARSAASRRRSSANSNAPQGIPPLGPQLPCPCQRRCHQRRARRRRLQLSPPTRMVEAFVAQNPDCAQYPPSLNPSEIGFFMADSFGWDEEADRKFF